MTSNQKTWMYRLIAVLPFFLGLWFVTFSQKEIYSQIPTNNSFVASTTQSSVEMLKNYPFRLGLDLSSGVRLTYLADTKNLITSLKGQFKCEKLK